MAPRRRRLRPAAATLSAAASLTIAAAMMTTVMGRPIRIRFASAATASTSLSSSSSAAAAAFRHPTAPRPSIRPPRPWRCRAASATRSPPSLSLSASASVGPLRRSIPTMMPEGPEVRTLVDQLRPAVGRRLVDLRFLSGRYVRHGPPRGFEEFRGTMSPFVADAGKSDVDVDLVTEWNAKGKFIYLVLDDGDRRRRRRPPFDGKAVIDGAEGEEEEEDDFLRSVWITLGMSGRFVKDSAVNAPAPRARGRTADAGSEPRWYLEFLNPASAAGTDTGRSTRRIYYLDPRNFGTLRFSLSKSELRAKLRSLGPDILDGDNDDEEVFLGRMEDVRPATNVCRFLMDQSKVSGVGNYILAEGLYRANVDPFAQMRELDADARRKLVRELRDVARMSYEAQGLSRKGGSFRDVGGKRGKFEFELQCYGRDYCPKGRPVLRETDGPHGRTIWYVEDQLFVPRWARREDGSRTDDGKREKAEKKFPAAADDSRGNERGEAGKTPGAASVGEGAVSELLRGLKDPSWTEALSDYVTTDKFRRLAEFIATERSAGVVVYPPPEDVFSALNLCPLNSVKAVIVGQDPYHGPGQGHGLAFSVRKGVPPPPSLKNIFREAMDDVGIPPPLHGCLDSWAGQGVLLLNAVLTVRRGEAKSHARKGWEEFTDEIVKLVNDRREGAVFLLWGAPAARKGLKVDETKHAVIWTSHPSPLGATKTASPFLGSRCFGRANAALEGAGLDPIDWTV